MKQINQRAYWNLHSYGKAITLSRSFFMAILILWIVLPNFCGWMGIPSVFRAITKRFKDIRIRYGGN